MLLESKGQFCMKPGKHEGIFNAMNRVKYLTPAEIDYSVTWSVYAVPKSPLTGRALMGYFPCASKAA